MSRPSLVPELYVSDLAASRLFYVDSLGFRIEYERPDESFCCLSRGDAWIMLEQVVERSAASNDELLAGRWLTADLAAPFGRGVNFELAIEDMDSVAARLRVSNHEILLAPHLRFYEIRGEPASFRVLLVADPDGYLIRLAERVSSES